LAIFRVYIGNKAKNLEEIFTNHEDPYTKYMFLSIVGFSIGIVFYIINFTNKLIKTYNLDIHASIFIISLQGFKFLLKI